MKPYDQGKEAFIKGKLGNPYKKDTRPNKDWEFGFNTEYFKNLEKVKQTNPQSIQNLCHKNIFSSYYNVQ